ncbi:MAG: SPFH domain-containing protein, partial [Chloroflexus sp.]|nr:SPFH domain-containing protein [Chloroflexus sp.]
QATLAAQSYRDELYLALQLALRDAITTRSLADLTAQRATIGNEILANVTPAAERLGLKLSMVELRDIVLPADLRRAFAQVAIARQEGLAALERARGEQAALRALANAARMIEQNPHLFHLRALQAIGERGKVIVHTGTASGPIDTQATPEN